MEDDTINYKTGQIKNIQSTDKGLKLTLSVDSSYKRMSSTLLDVTLPNNEVSTQYQIGDLIKFEEERPEILVKIPTDNIDSIEFKALARRIEIMTCEQLIATHHILIGNSESIKTEFSESYIKEALNIDTDNDEVIKFLNSKHVSDYFKAMIIEQIEDMYLPEEDMEQYYMVYNVLNSDRDIKEFNEKELSAIYELLQIFYDIQNLLISLLLKLNSQGGVDFLNNQIDPQTLIERIVATSGLAIEPEYYSGRGTRKGDLDSQNLMAIYNKLAKIDKRKALMMVKMTMAMPTLGATEFLKSLYTLAKNNYRFAKERINTNNSSLGRVIDIKSEAIGLAIISSTQYRRHDFDDTDEIKDEFSLLLKESLGLNNKSNSRNLVYEKE